MHKLLTYIVDYKKYKIHETVKMNALSGSILFC